MARVKAEVGQVANRMEALETRMVALFVDIRAELREQRRDLADLRERMSTLEARKG